MNERELYLALDFDGVLHSTQLGPTKKHCTDYAAGHLSAGEFLDLVSKDKRARYHLTSECIDFLFDRAAVFAKTFTCIPKVQTKLVIATSWRNAMSAGALQALVPAVLAPHVCGVLDPHEEEHREPGTRARLMEKWMAEHAPHARWLAVDDDAWLWEGAHSRLVQPPRDGLDGPTWFELRALCHALSEDVGKFDSMLESRSEVSA